MSDLKSLNEYVGYLKYSGKDVEDGCLDAKKAAEALLGLNEFLRYFIQKEEPSLQKIDFEIPVRIQKGSWDVWIKELITPQNIITTAGTAYLIPLLAKAAQDGFLETGPVKDIKAIGKAVGVVVKAIKSSQWMIRIASHLQTFSKQVFKRVQSSSQLTQNQGEWFLVIQNDEKEVLSIPQKYVDLYLECPEGIFKKNASIVSIERILKIGFYLESEIHEIVITEAQKPIFCKESEPDTTLFPELQEGDFVSLEGIITKVNEKANTIGFEYKEHVLLCKPEKGHLSAFKGKIVSREQRIFPRLKIIGVISRLDKKGKVKEKPEIIFSDFIPIESGENSQLNMF